MITEVVDKTRADILKFADPKNKQYQELLKKLIIQGMTQMLEAIIILRIRKQDIEFVKSILNSCESEYAHIMKDATGRVYSTSLKIDDSPLSTQLGGVHLFDESMKIQCTNDLESRLELSYTKLLPELKKRMFQ